MPGGTLSDNQLPVTNARVDALPPEAPSSASGDTSAAVEGSVVRVTVMPTTMPATVVGSVVPSEPPVPNVGVLTVARRRRRAARIGTALTLIEMRPGELHNIVNHAEAALLGGAARIFQHGTELVRPVTVDVALAAASTDVRRDSGSTVLMGVTEAWLVEQMGRSALWVRRSEKGKLRAADPGRRYAETLLARGDSGHSRSSAASLSAPTLTWDGRILQTPGYDTDSRLLLVFDRPAFPPVSAHPTRQEARLALAGRSRHPLRAFPFVSPEAQSVAVSAMLVSLVRAALRTSPLHGFDAPTAGTGKSLLAEAVGLLGTGYRPPALSQGKTAEEDEKRLSTVLFAGDPVIHLDNCEHAVSGDFLCSMLTQEVVQARILGRSERRVLPSTPLVLASGNNLTFGGDAARRAVVCRLDAGVERPDTRAFDFDCHAEVLGSRSELVIAGLTILLRLPPRPGAWRGRHPHAHGIVSRLGLDPWCAGLA